MKRFCIFVLLALLITATNASPETWAASPSQIGSDGYFYLNGVKTIMKGIEEERNILSNAQVNVLVPRLKETGINFLVIYEQNLQTPYFYQQMQANGIWIAQHLGTVKKELIPLPGTGGVWGTTPDEAWYQARLARLTTVVNTLKGYTNILFWWMGGEFVEPEFATDFFGARTTLRNHIQRYRDAVRALDPQQRPFTVSHHFLEAANDPFLPYLNYSNLTDFTWFTAATHMHSCDIGLPGWWPLFQLYELGMPSESALNAILLKAVALNNSKPIFMGGWYGNAPFLAECTATDQGYQMGQKWQSLSSVPHNGYSVYHLDQWNNNGMPHALFTWSGSNWVPTAAGNKLRNIATGK